MIVEMSAAVNRPAGTCNNEYVYKCNTYLSSTDAVAAKRYLIWVKNQSHSYTSVQKLQNWWRC